MWVKLNWGENKTWFETTTYSTKWISLFSHEAFCVISKLPSNRSLPKELKCWNLSSVMNIFSGDESTYLWISVENKSTAKKIKVAQHINHSWLHEPKDLPGLPTKPSLPKRCHSWFGGPKELFQGPPTKVLLGYSAINQSCNKTCF